MTDASVLNNHCPVFTMISSELKNNRLVLKINESRVDMVIARKFRETLANLAGKEQGRTIILDMGATEYFDSSALGALVAFMKEVKSGGGRLILCNTSRNIRTLLKLSRLDSIFTIAESLEDAINL